MNIHEYQAKALLRSYGAPVSDGRIVLSADAAKAAASEMDGPLWVVKAQIHAGGRGKGSFIEADAGTAGGVRLARSVDEAEKEAKAMLGRTLTSLILSFISTLESIAIPRVSAIAAIPGSVRVACKRDSKAIKRVKFNDNARAETIPNTK